MKKINEFTRPVSYAMGWAAGYRLCGQDEIYTTPLTREQIARLQHSYYPAKDDPVKLFSTREAAIKFVQKKDAPGRFVRIYEYSTPTEKHAYEYCVLRDDQGRVVKMADFNDLPSRVEIPDNT